MQERCRESILEGKDLKKNYGDFAAVKGIPFDIKEGEIFSLLGPNGAGKIITLSMWSTLYTPTAPAVANVVFDATGVRLPQMPFTPERIRAVLTERG